MAAGFNLPRTGDNSTLILIGASVRALAFSCIRAGYKPWTIDLYADKDLVENCPTMQITKSFPNEILELITLAPEAPILYSGGLENHPELLQELSKKRTVFGIIGQTLKELRNTCAIFQLFNNHQIKTPLMPDSTQYLNLESKYVLKPKNRSGGIGIKYFNHDSTQANTPGKHDYYLQEFIRGESRSAIFCFYQNDWELLGVTIQSSGDQSLHADHFLYCGNLGPIIPEESESNDLSKIGKILFTNHRPLGLLGLDYILYNSRVYPLEINPRYTASMEVLEMALRQNFITKHIDAFTGKNRAEKIVFENHPIIGKAIYYAPCDIFIADQAPWGVKTPTPIEFSTFADIPKSNSNISKGSPMVTMFARANHSDEVRNQLKNLTSLLDSAFLIGTLQNKLV